VEAQTLDPTAAALPDLGAIPDISLDTELVDESQPYLGVIVLDEYQPNYNKDGYQWTLGIRPIDFAVKGELACFFSRNNISTTPTSKMGITLKAFQAVFGKDKLPVGRKHLVGRIGVFVNRNVSFGMGDDGQERKARVTIPVRKANDEETARAQGVSDAVKAGHVIVNPTDSDGPASTPTPAAPTSFSEDDLGKMAAVISGKTPAEFQMAALSSGLPPHLMNALLSGAGLKALTEAGKAELFEGRVVVADEALV
jgi:hypothetical protein